MRFVLEIVLSVFLLPSQSAAWGGLLEPTGGGLYPYSPDSSPWQWAVATSNASASYVFSGRDVTKPYPSSEMGGWAINITAVDLTPDEIGIDVRIMAPPTLYTKVDPKTITNDLEASNARYSYNQTIDNVDPSWFLCAFITIGGDFQNASLFDNPDNKPTKPDGDCSPFLSSDCVKAIEKVASTSYVSNYQFKNNPYGARGYCRGFAIPKECGNVNLDFGGDVWTKPEAPIKYMTGATTFVNGWEYAKSKEDEEDNPLPSDAPLLWKSLTEEYVGIVTMFGQYNASAKSYEDPEPGFAKMRCVRPNGSKDQSKDTSQGSGQASGQSNGQANGQSSGQDGSENKGNDTGSGANNLSVSSVLLITLSLVLGW